jgi:hypothetical protein
VIELLTEHFDLHLNNANVFDATTAARIAELLKMSEDEVNAALLKVVVASRGIRQGQGHEPFHKPAVMWEDVKVRACDALVRHTLEALGFQVLRPSQTNTPGPQTNTPGPQRTTPPKPREESGLASTHQQTNPSENAPTETPEEDEEEFPPLEATESVSPKPQPPSHHPDHDRESWARVAGKGRPPQWQPKAPGPLGRSKAPRQRPRSVQSVDSSEHEASTSDSYPGTPTGSIGKEKGDQPSTVAPRSLASMSEATWASIARSNMTSRPRNQDAQGPVAEEQSVSPPEPRAPPAPPSPAPPLWAAVAAPRAALPPGHVINLTSPAPKPGNTGSESETLVRPLITVTHVGDTLRWMSEDKEFQIATTSPQESTLGSQPDGSEDGNSSTKSLETNASGQDGSTVAPRHAHSENGNSTTDKSSTMSYASMIHDSSTPSLASSANNPDQPAKSTLRTWASHVGDNNPRRGWTVLRSSRTLTST